MTTALPACEGVFMRTHCPHPQLFEEEYKRCFPHCCPHHVDRSYCGSSLEVVLRFDSDTDVSQGNRGLDVPFDVAKVFVFARFEAVDSVKPPADAYSLQYLRSVSQSEVSPEGSWIEGVRQTAADRQQHSQQLHGRQPPSRTPSSTTSSDSATFVLNGQAFAKWYYHWESGANKVQRATKHALKAYVFYQQETQIPDPVQRTSLQEETESAAQQDPARDGTFELLCVVTSPSFTVVSYRRAPLDASAVFPGSSDALEMEASASLLPHYATDTAHPADSRLHRLVQNQISRAFQEYNEQRQHDPHHGAHGPSDEPFPSFRALKGQHVNDERNPYDRYRQLQEREGLRFRLLTPGDAARSGSSPRESRLVFDRTRRRDDYHAGDQQHWRDTDMTKEEDFVEDHEEDDSPDEAVPQALTTQPWLSQNTYDVKAGGSIGTSPSTTHPSRQAERTASATLLQFKQQQSQFGNHLREVQQLTDLAIIQFFVSRITANTVGNSARDLANLELGFTIAISQHWRFASGGATHLARLLLAIADENVGEKTELLNGKREELILILGEICVWALSPDNVELMRSLLTACYPMLLEKVKPSVSDGCDDDGNELRTGFLDCVTRCWSALDVFLQSPRATQTKIRSVRELSDAVLGVVYSDPALEELRSGLRDMLQRPAIVLEDSKENSSAGSDANGSVTPRCNLVGWRGFVAQVREGYLRDQYSGRGLPWSPRLGTSARPSRWAADWLLQPNSLSATPQTDSQRRTTRGAHVPSMWTSCLALSQLLHLKIAAVGDPLHTLYVQAVPSVLFQDHAWLRLICDGRVRVAPVAPNGLTSLMGGAFCSFGGDYVAYRLEPQGSNDGAVSGNPATDNNPICLEFYWWPLGKTPHSEVQNRLVAFRSVVTLKTATSGAFMEAQMKLERGFVECESAKMPELEMWAPTERVQAVASWYPWLSIRGVYARK